MGDTPEREKGGEIKKRTKSFPLSPRWERVGVMGTLHYAFCLPTLSTARQAQAGLMRFY
jgi:hypothetical protein